MISSMNHRFDPYGRGATGARRSRSESGSRNDMQNMANARARVQTCSDMNIVQADACGNTILHLALINKDMTLVTALLDAMATRPMLFELVNSTNDRSQTPLFIAVLTQQYHAVHKLISVCNANPNIMAYVTDSTGRGEMLSPLHYCSSYGDRCLTELLDILHSPLIDLNVKSSAGMTALQLAIWKHNTYDSTNNQNIDSVAVVQALLGASVSRTVRDNCSGKTALHYAVERESLRLIELILNSPTESEIIEMTNFAGQTPLHIAAALTIDESHQMVIVNYLIKRGANKCIKDNNKNLPRDYVLDSHSKVQKILDTPSSSTDTKP